MASRPRAWHAVSAVLGNGGLPGGVKRASCSNSDGGAIRGKGTGASWRGAGQSWRVTAPLCTLLAVGLHPLLVCGMSVSVASWESIPSKAMPSEPPRCQEEGPQAEGFHAAAKTPCMQKVSTPWRRLPSAWLWNPGRAVLILRVRSCSCVEGVRGPVPGICGPEQSLGLTVLPKTPSEQNSAWHLWNSPLWTFISHKSVFVNYGLGSTYLNLLVTFSWLLPLLRKYWE